MGEIAVENPSLEAISNLLLITGHSSIQPYFLIASQYLDKLVSAAELVVASNKMSESDIGDVVAKTHSVGSDHDQIVVYSVTSSSRNDVLPSLASETGLESYDLGPVTNRTDFKTRADGLVKKRIQGHYISSQIEHFLENLYVSELLKVSRQLVHTHKINDQASHAIALNDLAELVPGLLGHHETTIYKLSHGRGGNRDKLIELQCRIVGAVMNEDYERASKLLKMYEGIPFHPSLSKPNKNLYKIK